MNKLTPHPYCTVNCTLFPIETRQEGTGRLGSPLTKRQPRGSRGSGGLRRGRGRGERERKRKSEKPLQSRASAELCRKGTQSGSGSVATHRVGPTLEEPTSSSEKERKGQKGPPRVASHEDLLHAESLPSAGSI